MNSDEITVLETMAGPERARAILLVPGGLCIPVREALKRTGWWLSASSWDSEHRFGHMEFLHQNHGLFASADDVRKQVEVSLEASPIHVVLPAAAPMGPFAPASVTGTAVSMYPGYVTAWTTGTARALDVPRQTELIAAKPGRDRPSYETLRRRYMQTGLLKDKEQMLKRVTAATVKSGEVDRWLAEPQPQTPHADMVRTGPDGSFLVGKEDFLRREGLLPPQQHMLHPVAVAFNLITGLLCLASMVLFLLGGQQWGAAMLALAGVNGWLAWRNSRLTRS